MSIDHVADRALRDLSPYALARLAECSTPDSPDSPGALMLRSIRDDVADALDHEVDDDVAYDIAHEIASDAPSIYVHRLWQQFVDLGAYEEDPSEVLGDSTCDMTQLASAALYAVSRRLVWELIGIAQQAEATEAVE